MTRRARGTALLAAAFACLALGCEREPARDARAGREAEVLEAAPEFVLPLLAGGEIALAELRGKTVLLDFWATWCAPCEVQMPILDALWREVDRSRLVIVGVSVDTDPRARVAQWVGERGFDYPIAFADQELAVRYGLLGFPSLVLIDPEGRIRVRHTGVWSEAEIRERLESLKSDPGPVETVDGAASGGAARGEGGIGGWRIDSSPGRAELRAALRGRGVRLRRGRRGQPPLHRPVGQGRDRAPESRGQADRRPGRAW